MMVTEELKYTREGKSKIILSKVKSNNIYGNNSTYLVVKDEISKIPIISNIIIMHSDQSNEYQTSLSGSISFDKESFITDELSVYADGYFPKTINIKNADSIEVFLSVVNKNYILEDVLFEYDSYELSEEVKSSLNLFIKWLKMQDEIDIKIEGHTDSVGSDSYNILLSKRRAEEVSSFFVSNGIDENKIKAVGLGDKFPIMKGYDGPRNRRIEISIL
jgi:outer membrane protein OmpA-like peptidoglycan-associated protein